MRKNRTIQFIKEGSKLDLFFTKQLSSSMFSYREILRMLFPIILDQFFIAFILLLTTAMISSSSQTSVSAVSLVSPIYMIVYAIFNAVASGGTVVVAQYKGRNDESKMKSAAGQVMLATSSIAIFLCALLIMFSRPIVTLLYGSADPVILEKSIEYLIGMSISLIFHSFYISSFSIFRGIGATKICLHLTMIINLIHLFASFLFINIFHMDILGTTLSLNIARLIGGGIAVWLLMKPTSVFRILPTHIFRIYWPILKSVYKVGLPFALEQVFFNGGGMIAQTFIVTLGTISIAANAIGNSILMLFYSAGLAVATLSITIIGQCVGANEKELAKKYATKMNWLGTITIVISILIFFPSLPLLLKLYNAPNDAQLLIYVLITIVVIAMPFFWSTSNVMPCVFRAAGDATFSSIFSLITMWTIRVGLGYVFAIPLGLGIKGVWICMGIEWAVRSVVFMIRYYSGVWLTKKVIS